MMGGINKSVIGSLENYMKKTPRDHTLMRGFMIHILNRIILYRSTVPEISEQTGLFRKRHEHCTVHLAVVKINVDLYISECIGNHVFVLHVRRITESGFNVISG